MMTTSLIYLLVPLFIATFFLTAVTSALRKLSKKDIKKQQRALRSFSFYRKLHQAFFPKHEVEGVFLSSLITLTLTRLSYAAIGGIWLLQLSQADNFGWWIALYVLIFLLFSFLVGDFFPRVLGNRHPDSILNFSGPFVGFLLTLTLPFTYCFLKLWLCLSPNVYVDLFQEQDRPAKQEILDIIEEADVSDSLEPQEKKMFESVVSFRDRIAKEVMVPRIDTFFLPANISIQEAAQKLQEEGYSRTPVYRETIDQVVGVLMYRDIMSKYMDCMKLKQPSILESPIETILKPVLYTPETKKISHLLQEFRKKQVHMAIVVDEYGGTEGIVTIEDILEEIVGEISDEYDEDLALFNKVSDHEWIVDARMSILDLEELLGIVITEEGDYDTLGGYLFHRAGTIPSKGFQVRQDAFDLEVISSSDRSINKVKVLLHPQDPQKHQ